MQCTLWSKMTEKETSLSMFEWSYRARNIWEAPIKKSIFHSWESMLETRTYSNVNNLFTSVTTLLESNHCCCFIDGVMLKSNLSKLKVVVDSKFYWQYRVHADINVWKYRRVEIKTVTSFCHVQNLGSDLYECSYDE